MRFLVNANLSPRLAVNPTQAGHDAVHVVDLGMSRATDIEILEVADREDRVVVSADADFGTLLAMGNRQRPSVLPLRLASPRRTEQLTAVPHLNLPAVLDALGAESVVVVEDARIRIRSLPMGFRRRASVNSVAATVNVNGTGTQSTMAPSCAVCLPCRLAGGHSPRASSRAALVHSVKEVVAMTRRTARFLSLPVAALTGVLLTFSSVQTAVGASAAPVVHVLTGQGTKVGTSTNGAKVDVSWQVYKLGPTPDTSNNSCAGSRPTCEKVYGKGYNVTGWTSSTNQKSSDGDVCDWNASFVDYYNGSYGQIFDFYQDAGCYQAPSGYGIHWSVAINGYPLPYTFTITNTVIVIYSPFGRSGTAVVHP